MLFVGSVFNRRRLPQLIEAFAVATCSIPDARLVIVGAIGPGRRRTSPSAARRTACPIASSSPSYVTTRAGALYARASVFAFLSEYEGFGLTPLEALAAGVPIVVLDTPVAREVYGPAATLRAAGRRRDRSRRRCCGGCSTARPRARRDLAARRPRFSRATRGTCRARRTLEDRTIAVRRRAMSRLRAVDRHRQLQHAGGSRALPRSLAARRRPPARDRRRRQRVARRQRRRGARARWPRSAVIAAATSGSPPPTTRASGHRGELVLLLNSDSIVPPARSTRWSRAAGASRGGGRRTALVDGDGPVGAVVRPMISPLGRAAAESARLACTRAAWRRRGRRAGSSAHEPRAVRGLGQRRGLLVCARRRRGGRPARRALFPLHRGRRLLRGDPGARPAHPLHAGGDDHRTCAAARARPRRPR